MTPLTVGQRLFGLSARGKVLRICTIERITSGYVFVPPGVQLDRAALDDLGHVNQVDSNLIWWTEEAINKEEDQAGLTRGTLISDELLGHEYSIDLPGSEHSMTARRPAQPQRHTIPKLRREIGGEIYDTETASVLHHARHDHDGMSFAFGSVLMLTVSDKHFVVDYNEFGAPDSVWLRPVTVQEAVHWAALHCKRLVHDIFGRLHERGEGPAYTPRSGPRKWVLDEWLQQQQKGHEHPKQGNEP